MLEALSRFLISANEFGIWDILTALSASSISIFMVIRYRKRLPDFSVHMTYSIGNDHSLYPNTLNFEVRNLWDSPIVVSEPNFRFNKKLAPSSAAHGNTATGDFEIKFRPLDEKGKVIQGYSYTSILLRHRQSAFSYIPFDPSLTEDDFKALLNEGNTVESIFGKGVVGHLSLSLVILQKGTPRVVSMRIPVKRLSARPSPPELGLDPAKKSA